MKAKGLIALAVVLLAWVSLAGPAQSREHAFAWTAYFGTHQQPAPWAAYVRGFNRKLIKFLRDPLSYDREAEALRIRQLVKRTREMIQTRDVIIPVGGHWNGKKIPTFLDLIERDSAKFWKKVVSTRALALAEIPGAAERIYWQIGNEINNKKIANALRRWAKRPQIRSRNDESAIPLYVEYFLAPSVEALHEASRKAYGTDDKIRIVLGTIASGRDTGATDWLAVLLRYEIRGRFAKSLAGKKVLDVVDVIGVHYIATKDHEGWLSRWEELRAKWLGKGRIRGVWATEELGKKRAQAGLGGATAIKVAFRYLHWWGRHAMTPREGRCSFWGSELGEPGTTGDEAMTTLYEFLGDVPLTELAGVVALKPGTDLETYTFEAPLGAKRVIAIISDRRASTVALERLVVGAHGWSGDVTASLHVFSPAGHTIVPVTARRRNSEYTLSPDNNVSLRDGAAAMIFLEPKSPRE